MLYCGRESVVYLRNLHINASPQSHELKAMPESEEYDYDAIDSGYGVQRRTDPIIAAHIEAALGSARTILNVGAGTGSYEPQGRYVVAVEPSKSQRVQRPVHAVPALNATAESLPFDDGAFDAAMAILTVHHWPNRELGLKELRRVTRGPVVVMTFDPDADSDFWLPDYAPELQEVERRRYGPLANLIAELGGEIEVRSIDVPIDCKDGIQEAFFARPEQFLDKNVRSMQSAWSFLSDGVEERIVTRLAADLASGAWDRKYGHLRQTPRLRCQLRLVISCPQVRRP